MKTLCLCSCILGVVGTSAFGQDIYMSPDGEEALGNHVVFMSPGATQQISAWAFVAPGSGLPDIGAYTVAVRCEANGGASGSINYDAGSQLVDGGFVGRADWIFQPAFPAFPTVFGGGESCAVPSTFGVPVAYTAFPNGITVIEGTPQYMQEWTVTSTADACGTFTVDFVATGEPPLGGSLFSDSTGSGGWGTPNLQSLTIVIGPGNDACADAATASDGGNAVDTLCATTDDPGLACNSQNDVWYNYTATCTGTLDATTTLGAGNIGFYSGACPASDGAELACGANPSIAVNTGDSVLIRVGSTDGSTGGGNLQVTCAAACTVGDSPANIFADCVVAGVTIDEACTDVTCDATLGCVFSAKATSTSCDDGDVCTLTDTCTGGPLDGGLTGGGGGSCEGADINPCNDFNGCTLDSCDAATGDAVTGCINDDVTDNTCTSDLECGDGTCGGGGICECAACPNQTGADQVCLEIRNAQNTNGTGECGSDADCPAGTICVDDNMDATIPGICVEQVCFSLGDKIVVDIELGSLTTAGNNLACGAQLAVAWDTSSLELKGDPVYDPNGDLAWTQVLYEFIDGPGGKLNFAVGVPLGTCDPSTASSCGAIARLSFTAIADCKSGGVWFDCLTMDGDKPGECNPDNLISGPDGPIPVTGCGGGLLSGSGIGADVINVNNDAPEWDCPPEQNGHADCNSILATVDPGFAMTVSDPCVGASIPGTTFCTSEFFFACETAIDCGAGDLCNDDSTCGGFVCVPDDVAGDLGFVGFCTTDTCNGVTCATASGFDVSGLIDGEIVSLPPGIALIDCSYTNDCGVTSTCSTGFRNSGMNLLCVDVEMSPSMVAGDPANPITRCIDFELTKCDVPGAPESFSASEMVVFGNPNHLPGHGSVCFKVPPGNWTCLTAVDQKHSLMATCFVECVDGTYSAEFKGSPNANPSCHWLIQGNLDGDEHIDIVDYTILAGQYLDIPATGANSACDLAGFHADLNGDGYVTMADFTFVVFNFFDTAKEPCDVICNPGLAPPKSQPRTEVSVRELGRMGLGEFARAADVNSDGKVNLVDMASFLELNSEGDDALTIDLLDAVDSRISDSAGLR